MLITVFKIYKYHHSPVYYEYEYNYLNYCKQCNLYVSMIYIQYSIDKNYSERKE